MGRKKNTIRTDENREAILDVVGRGGTNRDCAMSVSISESSLYKWLADDTDFGEDYARAKTQGRMKSIDILANSEDWRAHAWLLERKDPEHWAKTDATPEALEKKLQAYLDGVKDGAASSVSSE